MKCNLLIPMAGSGQRFREKGYLNPKPFIEVFEKPMISWVVSNFPPDLIKNYIFVCNIQHEKEYSISSRLNDITGGKAVVVYAESLTEGAACTTLLARKFIDNEDPLIIANSDQYVEWDFSLFYDSCLDKDSDGVILTFNSNHPKWSYAKLGDSDLVVEVAEKNPISPHATVGIYFWKRGSDYTKYAQQMIEKNIRTNNEFYVCPVYNQAIQDGKLVRIFEIKNDSMWGLGTPEDLESFLLSYKSGHMSG